MNTHTLVRFLAAVLVLGSLLVVYRVQPIAAWAGLGALGLVATVRSRRVSDAVKAVVPKGALS